MRKILASMACLAFVVCAGVASAQAAPTVEGKDANKSDAHDRPLGGVTVKLPAPATPPANPPTEPPPPPPAPPPPAPPPEGEDLPPTETPPSPPPPEDPPTYYGEPVQGKFAFLLDASGSMGGSRVASMRAETVSVINELTEDDEFDCVAYGGQHPAAQDYCVFLWQTLLPATDGNKSSAVSWVNGSATNPGGMTPSYACLKKSCQVYPSDLDKMIFLSDGYPNITGSAAQILADFPGWWSKFTECELIVISIGGGGATFMQQLAALAGGTYIAA